MQKENCILDILERERELTKEINFFIGNHEYWSIESKKYDEDFCKENADKAMDKIYDKKDVLKSIRSELVHTLKGYID